MNFKAVLSNLTGKFAERNIRYALMGGFALGLWGAGRTTVDLDFLVHRDDTQPLETIMKGMGYELKHHSENVSQYISPLKIFGEVDFLHAFRDLSLEMLSRAKEKAFDNGSFRLRGRP